MIQVQMFLRKAPLVCEDLSMAYRDIYGKCSLYLEKLSGASLEANVLKGIGTAGKAVGKFIGSIPVVKEAMVDEIANPLHSFIFSNRTKFIDSRSS